MASPTTIIPIASGKGGVGKTLLAANLAIALARAGHTTVAVDLDLGGSNLHTYLGIPNKHPGIGDFLKGKQLSFRSLALPTEIPNLSFVPGDGKTPFMANIPPEQRRLLIQEIMAIPARYVLLDLGAGSSFNTLNFFGITHRAMVVSTFETAAIMNFLTFLRNFMFRLLTSAFKKNPQVHDQLFNAFRQSGLGKPATVTSLLDMAARLDPGLADDTRQRLRSYRPRILFNMGENPDELQVCVSLHKSIQTHLGLDAEFFGFIRYDDTVRRAARSNGALLQEFPDCPAARCITALAARIIEHWDTGWSANPDSLRDDTRNSYRQ